MGQMFSVDGSNRVDHLMRMKDKSSNKKTEDLDLDVLIGSRKILKPLRPVGRLPQLNKRAKKMKRSLA